jgi:ElaB/YqjD/DUF883 family membrane-anchored ribosome-binding protein
MAITSTQIGYTTPSGEACEVLPVPPARQLPAGNEEPGTGIQELARTYTELARQALEYARISAIRAFYETRDSIVENSSRAAYKTKRMVTVAQDKTRNAQRRHPVQVLGVLAGTAFAAGVAIRIWRSHAL